MLNSKRVEIALQANKLRNGLGKVEETTRLVAQMSEELAEAQVTWLLKWGLWFRNIIFRTSKVRE